MAEKTDKIDIASVSYVLGILSIVFAFVSPVAGLILGLISLTQSKKHGVSRAKRLSTIGIILSIVFLIISIIALFYSINSGLTDFFPSI